MRLILALLFIGGTAALVCAQTQPTKGKELPKPPVVDATKIAGKTFEQWLLELSSPDPSKRETAIRAVCAFPPAIAVKALPKLIGELKKHSASTPVDLSVRCNLSIAFGELCGSGEKIDPKMQAAIVALLRNQLRDSQEILRFRALVALAAIGPDARVAIDDVFNYGIKDRVTYEVRQAAAAALGSISHEGGAGAPALVLKNLYDLLGDPAYQVRLAAIHALSTLGPRPTTEEVENYVTALLPVALKDPEPGLQIWARVAIIGATNDYKAANIDPIAKHAASLDPGVRAEAVQAIGTFGTKAKAKVQTLVDCLGDPDITVQASAIWAVGRMEGFALNALPILQKMADDPNMPESLKRSAKDSVEKIKGK